jgi:TatA/E family protein of Tat protein translocase
VVEGRPYLEGWCLRAEGVRLFRLDRVLSLDVLDVPSAPPAEAEPVDVDQGLFRPSPDDALVELELSAAGRWVAEYYPCESVTDLADGRLRVTLRTPDTGWVRRLAMRLGEDGRVVSPSSLVAEVREAATAALANYVALSPSDPRFDRRKLRLYQGACTLGPRRTYPALKRIHMIGDLFDSPWKILIVAVVIIVLFGSKKLPHAARSLGQSMRILKKEVGGLHDDDSELAPKDSAPATQFPQAQLAAAPAAAPADQQSQIDALQQQIRDLQRSATMDTPPANAAATAEPQRTQPS